jgi:putative ABC transport system permease protein
MISEDLYNNNTVEIGDLIVITSSLSRDVTDTSSTATDANTVVFPELEYTAISMTGTLVGTYIDSGDIYSNEMQQNAYTNLRNEILTTFDTLSSQIVAGYDGIDIEATYYLTSPEALADFSAEVYAKGLSSDFTVTTDSSAYQAIVQPVEGLKSIALVFCLIVLALGGVIIVLLSSIAIRERKYEIGVLRAIGMKKSAVTLGFWFEMATLTCISLLLGMGLGITIAQPLTNLLLEQQSTIVSNVSDAGFGFNQGGAEGGTPGGGGPGGGSFGGGGFGGGPISFGGNSDAVALTSMDVSLGFDTVAEIVLIALLLTSLVAVVASRRIAKFEPIKILMERN